MTKVVILAGGLGTRLREETEFKPKPMVEIGGLPILVHIIKNFLTAGFTDIIIATGYKGNQIKEYFYNYDVYTNDLRIDIGGDGNVTFLSSKGKAEFTISIVDTGSTSLTAQRLKKLEPLIGREDFICTYGDGLSNVDPRILLDFHKEHGKIATVTAVKPRSRFGLLSINDSNLVKEFNEKPIMNEWINGGFFCFSNEIFKYLNGNLALENKPMSKLVDVSQLMAFKHEGFWYAMDTYREFIELNEIYDRGELPWILEK